MSSNVQPTSQPGNTSAPYSTSTSIGRPYVPAESDSDPPHLCEQRSSLTHGEGMFALEQITHGQLIFHERPIVRFSDPKAPPPEIWAAYKALNTSHQHHWLNLTAPESKADRLRLADFATEEVWYDLCGDVLANYLNNSWRDTVSQESFLGVRASRFNHSCNPNAVWVMNSMTGRFEVRAVQTIEADAEIYLSYVQIYWPRWARVRELRDFGFECNCDVCSDPTGEAEQSRWQMYEAEQQLRHMKKPVDEIERIDLYAVMLDLQLKEPCMALYQLFTATLLEYLYLEQVNCEQAAYVNGVAQRGAELTYGRDFEMTPAWKQRVVNLLMLPWADSLEG
ncbi:uncharacterized protein LTR77_010079 [Saxophila tyrrhenica]|uniref:SET domain-containing protein n=1 Tax=Saxophila tyrrhenica TaxID=1690608 RepID=A0AAV9NXH7_9PEZI|nr:hypothetical protein LTR77_010079 [Saxophila tyrrhenica]